MGTDTFNNYTFPNGNSGYVSNNGNGTYTVAISSSGTQTLNGTVSPGSTSIQLTNELGSGGTYVTYQATAIGDGNGYIIVNSPEPSGTFVESASPVAIGTVYTPNTSFGNFNPVCFATGSLIETTQGKKPVEELSVGDLAVTASGQNRPIKWIGSRTVDCFRHPDQTAVWPTRIRANAFGPNSPKRDLLVSPGHAICLDLLGEVLVPASALINGATIVQVPVDTVTYWHIELDGGHDILLAEGQPVESYIDVGNRGFFETDTSAVDPERTAGTLADYCRPFHAEGMLVEAARSQLRARAIALGWKLDVSQQSGLHLLADGMRIEPDISGTVARFVLSAPVRETWLVSDATVPHDVSDSMDRRLLGTQLAGLEVDDGLDVRRSVLLDDPLLCLGFHEVEHLGGKEGAPLRRWTAGRAKLPAGLFADCRGTFFLRVELDQGTALGRWIAPKWTEADQPIEADTKATEAPTGRLSLVSKAA